MIHLFLSSGEIQVAQLIGKLRNEYSLATKVNARRDDEQDDDEMNIEAMGAEMAVAKYLNVFPDLSPTRGKLKKYDLMWRGVEIEVKRNHRPEGGDLLVPQAEPNEKARYILVYGSIPKFSLFGDIAGRDIRIYGKWTRLSKGPCWRVEPEYLSEWQPGIEPAWAKGVLVGRG